MEGRRAFGADRHGLFGSKMITLANAVKVRCLAACNDANMIPAACSGIFGSWPI